MLWSDAWLLLATIYAARERSASLEEVIAAADYIQHAVVTFEEMEGALARLTANGFLLFTDRGLIPTDRTLAFYREITRPGRGVLDEERDIEKFIEASEWSPDQKPRNANVGAAFPALTRTAFDAAVKGYLGKHPGLTGVKRKK